MSLTAAICCLPPPRPPMPCLNADIEDPYDCKKCRMSFSTLQDHRKHIHEVHSKEYHPCPTCGKIFSAPSMLERHMVTHVGGKPFSCGICNKAYQVRLAIRSTVLIPALLPIGFCCPHVVQACLHHVTDNLTLRKYGLRVYLVNTHLASMRPWQHHCGVSVGFLLQCSHSMDS